MHEVCGISLPITFLLEKYIVLINTKTPILKRTLPQLPIIVMSHLCLVMLMLSSFKEVIHFLDAITTTTSRTLIVVTKPFKDVVCMPTMATHHTEVACSFDCNVAN